MHPAQKIYGKRNEIEPWREFQIEMSGKNGRNWMHNALTAKTRLADLGYSSATK